MKLGKALKIIVNEEDTESIRCPFYLYAKLADFIGADYRERGKLRLLFGIDRRLFLVKRLAEYGIAEVSRIREEFSLCKDICNRSEFDEILDETASVLVKGYTPFHPEEPNEFDYGYSDDLKTEETSAEKKVEDHLTDESQLMQFTMAQLRGYCRTHGLKGYAALNKRELVKLVMGGGAKAPTPPMPQMPQTTHYVSRRRYGIDFWDILPWLGGALGIAVLIAGAVCLGIFADNIQWFQWQHIIGSVGGLLVCGVGVLLIWGLGWLMEEVIVTGFDGYRMAIPIVIAPLAIANFVLAFVFGEAYSIIFYWMSGYLLLASVIGTIYSFTDYETASGIFGIVDAVAVAGMFVTQMLVRFLG